LNNLPRCYSGKVSLWNGAVNKLFTACNGINVLRNKLGDICQVNAGLADCSSLQNISVKPCKSYGHYIGYMIAVFIIICAVVLFGSGLTLSGVILTAASVSIVLSALLTGIFSGWFGIFGYAAGFIISLIEGIKGIFNFYG
jgi:hypothetical protein